MLSKETDISTWPNALQVCKLPLPVQARFAAVAGICGTLEGPVAYAAGDAILTGVQGEHWTMTRAKFDHAYVPLAGVAGQYLKRPLNVWAAPLDSAIDVPLGDRRGTLHGVAGDWLLQYGPGDFGVVASDIFDKTYRVLL